MPPGVEFGLLGPLMVRRDGVTLPVPRGKQRSLLAILLLHADHLVTVDQLTELLWATEPLPRWSATAVRNHVVRLRRTLSTIGQDRIMTQPGGYMIHVHPGELDITVMEGSLATARDAARGGDWQRAASHATAALDLWRGEPLSGVVLSLLAEQEISRLAELRLEARELRIEAELNLGRHSEVASELGHMVAASSLREHLHALLMLALYRSGRRAEALDAYQSAREVLLEQLGSDPGPELQNLQRQILSDDPSLAPPPVPGALIPEEEASRSQEVPRELPGIAKPFSGRVIELQTLTGLLDRTRDEVPGTVVISAIGGTAGVGKTALAVRWAHQVAGRFPDGQLYVDLRGYDPDQPMRAGDALAGFLRSLGVAGTDIPLPDGERAARYRSLLADRRILILLDNARDAQQVRPLLPGTPSCVTIVTSRDTLAGLAARDGATRLELDALPLADCLSLLRSLIGNRVDEDPRAAQELAHACCRLPLALRIAAELAANRPGTTLAGLVAELSDQQTRLDLLGADGDPRTMMRAVFSWSYRHLPEDAARAFRLAGLHPGPHWGRYAIGALANVTADEADAMIRVLTSAHLVAPIGAGRYLTHDLLRAYARDLAADRDSEADRTAALSRLFDFYLQTAASAMDVIYPGDTDRPAAPPTSIRASHAPFADEPEALDWLDAVRPALVVVATHMTESGWPGHAVRLAGIVWRYLDSGGHFPEAVAIHIQALRAARDTGNRGAEGTALLRLGVIDYRQGRYESATNHLKQALPLFSGGGDQNFEARTMSNLGLIELQQGRHDQAADYLQRSLVLFRECDDRKSEAFTVCNLGMIDLRQGRHDQAATRLEQSRAWFHKHGDRVTSAYALLILGELDLRQGRYGQAGERIQEALAIWRETGYRSGEADALTLLGTLDGRQNRYDRADERLREALDLCTEIGQPSVEANVLASLGLIELARGRHALAGERLQQALDLFREIGDLTGECTALNGLGEVFFATGHPDQAAIWHSDALRLADQAGLLYEEARAHDGIGNACDALGETSRSRSHWERALSLYTELGTPEAEQVRARFPLRD